MAPGLFVVLVPPETVVRMKTRLAGGTAPDPVEEQATSSTAAVPVIVRESAGVTVFPDPC